VLSYNGICMCRIRQKRKIIHRWKLKLRSFYSDKGSKIEPLEVGFDGDKTAIF
jgi:hypothetical protein